LYNSPSHDTLIDGIDSIDLHTTRDHSRIGRSERQVRSHREGGQLSGLPKVPGCPGRTQDAMGAKPCRSIVDALARVILKLLTYQDDALMV
jgi:hypothetical protein